MTAPGPVQPTPAQTEAQFSADTAATFLRQIFAGQEQGYAVLHTLPDRSSVFYDLSEPDWATRMALAAINLRTHQNVYFAVCSQQERLRRGRGGVQTVLSVPGLWADIDIWRPGASRDDLPRSEEDAWQIIDRVPIRPTLTVRSGNGLHVYWLFREPFAVTTPQERQYIAGLSVAALRMIQQCAAEQGWHVDSTADLARVLRLPGTHNRKDPRNLRLVTFAPTEGEPRSNPSDWVELLDYEDDPELARTVSVEIGDHNLGADFGSIAEGCSWLRHTITDAATLAEPEWYRALAVAGRCRGGRQLAHEISRSHIRYSPAETDAKLEQACHASRAPRCSYVATNFDGAGEHCKRCPSFGRINSPVKLGFPRPQIMAPPSPPTQHPDQPSGGPETVEQAVHRLISHNDLVGVFALVPALAQLGDGELAVLKAELRQHFGRSFPSADFQRAIKTEQERIRAERARVEIQSRPEWERELLRTSAGAPKPNLANAVLALEHAPDWAGVLAFDEFAGQVVSKAQAPITRCEVGAPWTDEQYSQATIWLQQREINVATPLVWEAVQTVARRRGFHPVREYLNRLHWDGEPRISTWLTSYAQVAQSEYSSVVGEKWLISAVARIFEPGCKVDTCLILEGQQGWKKSSTLKALADPWFSDELGEIGDKDTLLKIQGVWVVEIGEMSSFVRSEIAQIKKWMSTSSDKFRSPYGRATADYPRQCVFAGTVNPGGNGYLRDETGARRFWPVECTGIADLDAIRRDRDQIWAEAVERYREGVQWWVENSRIQQALAAEAADRYEEDPWQKYIDDWCDQLTPRYVQGVGTSPIESERGCVIISEVLWHAIGKPADRQTAVDFVRVARCLVSAGWRRRKVWFEGRSRWAYVAPGKWTEIAPNRLSLK